jgi:hypothetical protein
MMLGAAEIGAAAVLAAGLVATMRSQVPQLDGWRVYLALLVSSVIVLVPMHADGFPGARAFVWESLAVFASALLGYNGVRAAARGAAPKNGDQ